jgi:hypothetical protein
MALGRTWRLLVIAALLFAQQVALAHQVWHVASGSSLAAAGSVADPAKGNPLCDQHAALKAVLGALNGQASLALLAELVPVLSLPTDIPAASLAALSPSSRGPPASV